MTSPQEYILKLNNYGVGFGEKIILSSVELNIPERGVFVLVGPAGTGKSTLLRTISGLNNANPSLRVWGNALYCGTQLGDGDLPVLVAQNTRLMLSTVLDHIIHDLPERRNLTKLQQIDICKRLLSRSGLSELTDSLRTNVVDLPLNLQRHLAIVRSAAANPKLLCIDEPTTGLSDAECHPLIDYIVSESQHRALLVVVHNQRHAKLLGGNIALLAGGWIHEHETVSNFFSQPQSKAAQSFVSTGSCDVPSPNAKPEELDEQAKIYYTPPKIAKDATQFVSDAFGPRNFLWLQKNRLAGTPKPGLLTDVHHDLKALKRVGITLLVSLTEQPFDTELLDHYHIKNFFFPIPDMGVPNFEDAVRFCERLTQFLEAGEIIAVHCKAGLGRTGTMLASMLIWEGQSALDALENTRKVEPRWVQSEEQVEFLALFENYLNNANDITSKCTA